MKKIFKLLTAVALVSGVSSCDNWSPADPSLKDGQGQVRLATLGVDISDNEIVVPSRADVDTAPFIVEIADKATSAVVESWTYAEMPEVLTLPVGDYTVNVKSHNVEKAAWSAPYYAGSADFSIVKNKVTDLGTVTCKFANIRVTIKYSADFKARMGADAFVNVVANDEGSLNYSADETRSGYFEAVEGSNTLVASFSGYLLDSSGAPEATPVSFTKSFADAAAGKHYVITFKLKTNDTEVPDETGSVDPSGVSIDADIELEDNGISVPVEEDTVDPGTGGRPQEGDPEPVDPPTPPVGGDPIVLTSATLYFDGNANASHNGAQANPTSVSPAEVNIHADSKVAHLEVTIASDSDNFIGAVSDLMPTTFDLAEPGEYAEAYEGLGFPVGADVNQADLTFKITDFVPLLAAFPGNHTFTIKVTDMDGNVKSAVLKFAA